MNLIEREFVDFAKQLNAHNVHYIVVGGLAVNAHGFARATGDVDVWLEDSTENRKQLTQAMLAFGVEGAEAFEQVPLAAGYAELLFGQGVYADLMTDLVVLKQKDFAACLQSAMTFELAENTSINIIDIHHLLQEKKTSTRFKDREDALQLQKIIDGNH